MITEIFWRPFWRDDWRSLIGVVENFRFFVIFVHQLLEYLSQNWSPDGHFRQSSVFLRCLVCTSFAFKFSILPKTLSLTSSFNERIRYLCNFCLFCYLSLISLSDYCLISKSKWRTKYILMLTYWTSRF